MSLEEHRTISCKTITEIEIEIETDTIESNRIGWETTRRTGDREIGEERRGDEREEERAERSGEIQTP
jgi:hypothetical protein